MFLLMRLFRSVIGYFLGVFQRDGMEDAAIEEGRSGGPRPCAGPTHAFKISDGPDDSSDTISGELVQVVVVGKTKAGHKPLRKLLSWDSLPRIVQLVTKVPLEVKAIEDCIRNQPESLTHVDEKGGNTVLHRLIENIEENDDGHKELLKLVLEHKIIDVNATNISLNTPLHIAAKNNKYKTIKMLLQSDADINAKNSEGNTCLHVAVMHGSIEVVARLHCYAADNHLNEKLTNQQGFTALSLAEQILFNEDRTRMGKICNILNSPAREFRDEKLYENYFLKESEDDEWSLRPKTENYITVKEGAFAAVGHNTFSFPSVEAAKNFPLNFPGTGDQTLAITAPEEEDGVSS